MSLSPFIDWPAGLQLILASASPRRAQLLEIAGIPFLTKPADDVESRLAAELTAAGVDACRYSVALAKAKAEQVSHQHPDRLVLGADTVVVLAGSTLEKPVDEADAVRLLQQLAGQRHTVVSAVALIRRSAGVEWTGYEQTEVEFLPLSQQHIERYVATGEPMDKAGAYGIQGYGSLMVRRIEGCYFNVMGLPLALLGSALREILDEQDGGAVSGRK